MQLDLGIVYGNIVNIAFGIRFILRIKAFDKFFKAVKIMLKLLFGDFGRLVIFNPVSGKDIDFRIVDGNGTRRDNTVKQSAQAEGNRGFRSFDH